jgi:hypothetical protein
VNSQPHNTADLFNRLTEGAKPAGFLNITLSTQGLMDAASGEQRCNFGKYFLVFG